MSWRQLVRVYNLYQSGKNWGILFYPMSGNTELYFLPASIFVDSMSLFSIALAVNVRYVCDLLI